MPLIEGILTVANITSLLSRIYDGWCFLQDNRQRELDRIHQRYILDAQHRHELALEELRSTVTLPSTFISIPAENAFEVDTNSQLLHRLQYEAQKLSEMNYDVIYEGINENYGLALPIGENLTIGFLISPRYPNEVPVVLVRQGTSIEEIPFDAAAWDPMFTLVEILTQLVLAYTDSDEGQPVQSAEDVPPN